MSINSTGPINQQPQALEQQQQTGNAGVPNQNIEEAAKGAAQNVVGQTQAAIQDNYVRDASQVPIGKEGQAIPPPGLPPINPTADEADGAQVLADNFAEAFGPVAQKGDISKLSADELMKFFMMLNILDPQNSKETQENLAEAKTLNAQQAIDAAQKTLENLKEQLKEAEQKAAMWGMISNLMLIINPMGMVFKMAGDNETMGVIGGVLAPEMMLVEMFGAGKHKEKIEELKGEITAQEGRIKNVEYLVSQWPPAKREKFDREWQEAVDKMKAETASAGEDGVPMKGLAKQVKGKLGDALKALQVIGAEQGPMAMMQAARTTFHDAILPVFQQNNLRGAEAKANEMADLLTIQLAMGALGNPSANNAVGPATILLAEKVDPDSTVDVDKEPEQAFIAGHQDAIQQLRGWAEKFRESNALPTNVQG